MTLMAIGVLLTVDVTSQSPPPGDVVVNFHDVRQRIDGFGGSDSFLPAFTDAQADLFFSATNGIGLSMLRVRIGPDGEYGGQHSNAMKAAARGAIVWGAPWTPPAAWKDNGSLTNGGHLLPAFYDAWATRLANFANVLQQNAGVPLYGISPQAEPDWVAPYDSAIYTNQELVDFIKVLGPKLAALTPRPKLITPETASWTTGNLWGFVDAIMADPVAASYTDVLATHQYGWPFPVPHALPAGKPLWQTEASSFDSPTASIGNGIMVAKWIHSALVDGSASAWLYWWLLGNSNDNEGLLNLGGSLTKRLYTLGNFSKFVRPGFVRVGTTGGPSGVYVSAYKNTAGNTLAIVAINDSGANVPFAVTLNGLGTVTVTPWVTSGAEDLAPHAPIGLSSGRFTTTLPASTVTTFVSTNAVPPPPDTTPPSTPTGLSAAAVSSSQIDLLWTASTDNVWISGYRINRNGVQIGVASTNSYSDTGLSASAAYTYTVSAFDAAGNLSAPSTSASATTLPPEVPLPAPWASQDIGSPAMAGHANYNAGSFSISCGGTDIWNTSDQFRFAHRTLTGDGEIIARVASLQNTDGWAKAGVMIRQDLTADAPNAVAIVTAAQGQLFQWRAARGGSTAFAAGSSATPPQWIRLVRAGNNFSGYYSANGTTWTLMSTGTVVMPAQVYVGLAVTSHNAAVATTATFDNVTVTGGGGGPNQPPTLMQPANQTSAEGTAVSLALVASDPDGNPLTYSATGLPATLSVNPTTGVIAGTLTFTSAGTYTVTATASDGPLTNSKTFMWTVTDVVSPPSVTNLSPTAGPVGTAVTITGANFGTTQGTSTVRFNGTTATPTSWSPTSIVAPVPSGATSGLVVGTVGGVASNGVTFTVSGPGSLPAPWSSQDVGTPAVAGQASYGTGTFSISGAGTDIWDTTDQFQFVYQALTGDGEIIARVASLLNTDGWAKAGVMIRQDLTANAPNADAIVTAAQGQIFQWRAARGGSTAFAAGSSAAPPQWIRLVRAGNSFSGYYSANGTTWTLMSTSTVVMPAQVYVGLAVTSHNAFVATTATFDNVTVTGGGGGPNQPPTLTQPANQTSAEGTAVSLGLVASDPDGNPLTYSATGLPATLSVNPTTGVIAGTLTFTSAGTYTVTATASDGPLTNSKTFTWTVTDVVSPPNVTNLSPTAGLVGTAVTITGANFGTTQGTSTVRFNGTTATPTSWSPTSIVAPVPSGATSGLVVVTVGGVASNGVTFTVSGPGSLPAPWSSQDVGTPAVAGQASYGTGTFSISGAGTDIWDTTDQFQFVYQALTGDGEIIARVASLQNTDGWAKAGVMIREDLTGNAPNVIAEVTALHGPAFQWRATRGSASNASTGFLGAAPQWIRLVRAGNSFSGYYSTNGTTWTLMSTSTVVMPASVYVGLALTSHNAVVATTATFDNVTVTGGGGPPPPSVTNLSPIAGPVGTAVTITGANFGTTQGTSTVRFNGTTATPASWSASSIVAPVPSGATSGLAVVTVGGVASNGVTFTVSGPGSLPAPWSSQDVGTPAVAGQASYGTGTFSISGAGTDIWDTSDQFQFVYQALTGDGEIIARVASLQSTDGWAKAGVMIREDLTGNAPNVIAEVTALHGPAFQWRATRGSASNASTGFPGAAPQWIRLVRAGNSFSGYYSTNGTTWTLMSTSTVVMPAQVYVGLAVTSHNAAVATTATFDNVTVTAASQSQISTIAMEAGRTGDQLATLKDHVSVEATPTSSSRPNVLAANDYDGDGKADLAAYRPSTGEWRVLKSLTNYETSLVTHWGTATDLPVPGDYDGDRKTDMTYYRPSTGTWSILTSVSSYTRSRDVVLGADGDVPVPGDFDGDGMTDPAVYSPSTGQWRIRKSTTSYVMEMVIPWGTATDIPVPGDYDGDGRTDPAVYRLSTSQWNILQSASDYTTSVTIALGTSADILVPADYDGDGVTDAAVFQPANGRWMVRPSSNNSNTTVVATLGDKADVPVAGDYDGDGRADVAVFHAAIWQVLYSSMNSRSGVSVSWFRDTDVPLPRLP